MLTPRSLKTANGAGNYFYKTNGDYLSYMEKNFCGSEWAGKLAEIFKLSGKVDEVAFRSLLDGQLPTGEILGVEREGKRLHRPGIDLTMAAPKSVSVLWMLGDERLFDAHVAAVKATFAVIEKELAQARKTTRGETRVEKTDNLVAALFHHFDTRAGEVSLHTHTVVMNMTQRADEAVRALASSLSGRGFSDQIFARQKAFGLIYRQKLASCVVNECGYDIKVNPHDGTFDIVGVPQSVIEATSSRTEIIEQFQKENPFLGGKALDKAKRGLRPGKSQLSFDDIKKTTEISARACGWDATIVIDNARAEASRQPALTPAQQETLLIRAMNTAARQLAEREAVFDEDSLMQLVGSRALGKISYEQQKTMLATFLKKEWLLPVEKNALGVNCYTTPKALALERANVLSMLAGQGTRESFLSEKAAITALELFNKKAKFPMTKDQFKAGLSLLTTRDSITAIQGYSGVGKTTMMRAVREILEKQQVSMVGISSTAEASRKLELESGIPSMTLTKFLHQGYKSYWPTSKAPKKPLLILVDEASMISSRQQQSLDKLNRQLSGHLVLCGDRKQLAAIEAGKPFSLGQDHGLATTPIQQVVRQPKGSHLYQVSQALIKGNVSQAFSLLSENMEQNNNVGRLIESICQDYFALSRAQRQETLVITPSNELRETLNASLREGLIQRKELGKRSMTSTKLVSKNWTLEEKKQAILYQPGDFIRFNRRNSTLGVKPNTYGEVVETNDKTNTVLIRYEGREISWSPHRIFSKTTRAVEVFTSELIDIAKGEKLRWTRNDRQASQINSETMTVLSIGRQGQLKVRTESGKKKVINSREKRHQHLDYAYANTVYSAQGQSFERVMGLLDSRHKTLLSQALFYVVCTRARSHCKLYLDDIKSIRDQIIGESGEKTSSLESLKYWLERANKSNQKTVDDDSKKLSAIRSKSTQESLKTRYDLPALQQAMNEKTNLIAREILGEPNAYLSSSSVLRFGKKGSLAVTLAGSNTGCWYDFGSGEGGHLLQLLQREKGVSFIEACQLGSQLTGQDFTQNIALKETTIAQKSAQAKPLKLDEKSMKNADQKAILKAQKIWQKTGPIEGTIAEQYLKKARGIYLEQWPKSLGFLPCYYHYASKKSYPALVMSATRNEKIEAVQVILLDKKTGQKAALDNPKITQGRPKYGAMVDLSIHQKYSHSELTLVAEGPETALSILSANPDAKVLVSLSEGNLKNALKNGLKAVIFCLDNDGKMDKHQQLLKTISVNMDQNQTVYWAMPSLLGSSKTDFNDVLKQSGPDTIKTILDQKTRLEKSPFMSKIAEGKEHYLKGGSTNIFTAQSQKNVLSSSYLLKEKVQKALLTTHKKSLLATSLLAEKTTQPANASIDKASQQLHKYAELEKFNREK